MHKKKNRSHQTVLASQCNKSLFGCWREQSLQGLGDGQILFLWALESVIGWWSEENGGRYKVCSSSSGASEHSNTSRGSYSVILLSSVSCLSPFKENSRCCERMFLWLKDECPKFCLLCSFFLANICYLWRARIFIDM